MVYRKYKPLLGASAIVSIVSFILVCISFNSEDWIDAIGSIVNTLGKNDSEDSIIHYGLFKGTLIRSILSSPKIYTIYFTCVWEENACAWCCLNDNDARQNEVKALIRGEKPTFSCSPRLIPESRLVTHDRDNTNDIYNEKLLNAGMNLSAILLIILTMISLFICATLGIVNYVRVPKSSIFNLPGIFLSSFVAFVFNISGVIVYGCYFDYWIKKNIAILDTIVGEYESFANLGTGYWLFMSACFLNLMTILLVYVQLVLLIIEDRAETVVVVARVNDPTTVLY